MYSDFHIHSLFSDDSNARMEDQIERAISLGMDEICFCDHVDYGIKKDWDEGEMIYRNDHGTVIPVANVDYPRYFEKLSELKERKDITVRSGLEFGIQTHTIPQYKKLLKNYGKELDFILLSIHQVDDLEFWTGDFMKDKTREYFNRRYYQELLDVITEYKGYDVLAHIDLICRYDPEGPYPFECCRDLIEKILMTVIKDGKGIEINTSSWRYNLKNTTPSLDILKLYKKLGGTIITIGSDAHKPEQLGDHFDEAGEILKSLGFTSYYTYTKHRAVARPL